VIAAILVNVNITANAADWIDNSIGYRYGTNFSEPYVGRDLNKSIVNLESVSGYKYGTNYFNLDCLMSNAGDPSQGGEGKSGATEFYLVYRNTVNFHNVTGKDLKIGPIKDFGFTFGADLNTKNNSYGSRKRLLVAGPSVMFDVPGLLKMSILLLDESNAPNPYPGFDGGRYTYQIHPELNFVWGLPLGSSQWEFNGYANFITSKGRNESGGNTAAETHIDAKLMYDTSNILGLEKNTFKVGFGYEYWHNKYGNPTTPANAGAGPGATASTPIIRAEYHF